MRKVYVLLAVCLLAKTGWGQFSIPNTSPQTQNFDGIGTSSTATLPSGFVVSNGTVFSSGTTATTQAYGTSGSGIVTGSSSGGTVNWANGVTGSSTDRSVGFLSSGTYTAPRSLMAQLENNTGATITNLTVSFDYEKYRSGTRAFGWTFFGSTDGTTWTALPVGDHSYATDANNTTISNPPLSASKTVPITGLSIANGASYYLRWTYTGAGGSTNAQGLGVDNITVTATPPSGNSSSAFIFSDNLVFSPPTNIAYKDYQAADITSANSIEIGFFIMNDGPADADNLATTLTSLTFSVSNSSVFRKLALYTLAGVELAEVAVTGATVTFNGLNITAGDGSIQSFYLRATYNAPVTDNTKPVLKITSATADPNGSGFAAADAGGAETFSNGDENRIAVIADRLAFVQDVVSPVVGVNQAITPAPSVETIDILGSRDLDYTSLISLTPSGGTMTPIQINAVAGFVTFNSVIFTAPSIHTRLNANGLGLLVAISNEFDVVVASGLTDRFRSAATGNWNAAATWESSPDGITWIAATLVPNENANTITIRNGHTVTLSTAVTADEVVIESGGILLNSGNTFTINDGTGDDVIIQNGGIFTLASSAGPAFAGAAPVVNINGSGILRISRTGYTGAGSGMNSANYVYQNGAIAEYTLNSAFSSSGVTFFPNADASTIPVFRFTGTSVSAGSGGATAFNGVFDAVGNVTFTGAGVKTFRNGITGAGSFNGSASGKFIISGTTASLGGSGTLTLPTTDGLEISAGSVSTLNSSKTISGNISLLAGSFIALGNNDLTITGAITGGAADRYVRTDGTGVLTINNITAGAVVLPIGNSTYNPLTITNGSGLNWSARVEDAVNNVVAPFNTDKAINRTWHIAPSAIVTTGPDITFSFDDSDPGQLANPVAYAADGNRLARFWHYSGAWVSASGSMPMTVSPGAQTLTLIGYTSFSPFAIAKTTGALPVEFGNVRAKQQANTVKIEWTNYTELDVLSYAVERSINGRDFTPVGNMTARLNDGTRADYSIIDASPVNGVNYYRVRSAETNGLVKYSTVVKVDLRGGRTDITLYPNPLNGNNLSLQATSLAKGQYNIKVFNAGGQQVGTQTLNHNGGSITEPVQLPVALKAGLYQLVITGAAMNVTKTFVVQ